MLGPVLATSLPMTQSTLNVPLSWLSLPPSTLLYMASMIRSSRSRTDATSSVRSKWSYGNVWIRTNVSWFGIGVHEPFVLTRDSRQRETRVRCLSFWMWASWREGSPADWFAKCRLGMRVRDRFQPIDGWEADGRRTDLCNQLVFRRRRVRVIGSWKSVLASLEATIAQRRVYPSQQPFHQSRCSLTHLFDIRNVEQFAKPIYSRLHDRIRRASQTK